MTAITGVVTVQVFFFFRLGILMHHLSFGTDLIGHRDYFGVVLAGMMLVIFVQEKHFYAQILS